MNKKYVLSIPIKVVTQNPDGSSSTKTDNSLKVTVNTLLNPYLISDSALLTTFIDESDIPKYANKARELIFNASIRAEEFMFDKMTGYSPEHILLVKRELALCYALNGFSKFFYKDYYDSERRTKLLGDFSITTSYTKNPAALKDTINESNTCIEEAKKAITDMDSVSMSLGLTNDKGRLVSTNAFSYRLWVHSNLPFKSYEIYATDKGWYKGNLYKDALHVPVSGIGYYERNK